MMLRELMDKFSSLDISEKRSISDEYVELVFYNKEVDEWSRIFSDAFGVPVKPAGVQPTEEDLSLTKEYGGILENQTLFKKEFDNVIAIAMFWPWQNGTLTTLKVALLNK